MPRQFIREINDPAAPSALFDAISAHPYCFFLDGESDNKALSRFSFLGSDPFLVFKSKGRSIRIERRGVPVETLTADPFAVLGDLFKRYRRSASGHRIPFTGGGVGYFSYDLKCFIEELPDISRDDLRIPDCIVGFYDTVIAYDHAAKRWFVAGTNPAQAKTFEGMIRRASAAGRGRGRGRLRRPSRPVKAGPVRSNFSKARYIRAIEKAKRYIEKGDIYQVNLSQRFSADLAGDPRDLYRRLRLVSPAPFSSYLGFGDVAIVSSSPERFLMKKGDYIETRPIKGTRPRGADAPQDAILERELIGSAKDHAEHIMIVDLERNDLGRISEYGSVRPTETAVVERYPNVFHLVSTVAGKLRKGTGPIDCLRAAFPGGSITGAPKIRSMEIIEELEPVKRSVYTGAIGYISFDGNIDTSIAIRTFIITGKKVYFSVGGGIVADSDPELEYEETLHKAAGMFSALGIKNCHCEEARKGRRSNLSKEYV